MSPALLFLVAAVAAALWYGNRPNGTRTTPIAPADPIWRDAIERARATTAIMRGLHEEGRVVWIKFPLGEGPEREHVWGLLLALEDDAMRCTLETPPLQGAKPKSGEFRVPLHDLEDWQVLLDDGSVRGGFTTRAQMQIADRDHQPVPRHVRELVSRMID